MSRNYSPKVRKRVIQTGPHPEVLKLSKRFANQVDKEFKNLVRAAVLFGSCATDHTTNQSDIDILFIVDDVEHHITPEVTVHYREVITKAAGKISSRFHVNTLKLSNFWEYCREGDPVVTNMLRDGYIIIDKGFFGAAQLLLQQGRIRPSRESVWSYYTRAAKSMQSSQKHILSACVDLYWSAIDAAHSALMSVGEVPASPEHVPDLLQKALVKKGMLKKHHPRIMRELYHLQKGITHREIKEVTGQQYEGYYHETLVLVDALRTIVEMRPPGR